MHWAIGLLLFTATLGGLVGATPLNETPKEIDPKADPKMLLGIEDRKPVGADDNAFEVQPYNYLLSHAHSIPSAAIKRTARKDVKYDDLMEEPAKFRGEIVALTGHVHRLRKFEAPRALQEDGIKQLYEAWIFPANQAKPCCVVFTELPEGLEPGDKIDREVQVDGYFFKSYAYKTPDKWLVAPLLLGRGISVLPAKE